MNKKIAIFIIASLFSFSFLSVSYAQPDPPAFSEKKATESKEKKQDTGPKAGKIHGACETASKDIPKNKYILTLMNVEPKFDVEYYGTRHVIDLTNYATICKKPLAETYQKAGMSFLSIFGYESNFFVTPTTEKNENRSPMNAVIANCDRLRIPNLQTIIVPDDKLKGYYDDACSGGATVLNSKECLYWNSRYKNIVPPFAVSYSIDEKHNFKADIIQKCALKEAHVFSGSNTDDAEKKCKEDSNSYWDEVAGKCIQCKSDEKVDGKKCVKKDADKPTPPTPEQQKELDDKCKSLHGPTCTGERDDNKLICKCVESCKDSNDPNVTCKQTFKPRDDEKEKQKALEAKKEKDRAECTRLQMDFDGTRCVPRNQRQNGAGTGRQQGNQQQQPKQQPQQQRGQQGGQGGQQQQQPQQQPQQCPPGTVNAAQYGQYQNPYGGSTLGTSGTLGTLGTLGTQTPVNTGMYGGQQIQCVPIQQQYPPIYPTSTSPFLNMLTQSTTCNSFDIVDVDDTNKIKRNKSFVITWDITTPTGNPSSSIRVNVSPSEKITYKRSDQRATITPTKLGTHTISLALPSSQKENCPSIKFKVVK